MLAYTSTVTQLQYPSMVSSLGNCVDNSTTGENEEVGVFIYYVIIKCYYFMSILLCFFYYVSSKGYV